MSLHTKVQKLTLPTISEYPFDLSLIKNLDEIEFTSPVTFILGENGSGKSTLLESIAAGTNAVAIGADEIFKDPSFKSARELSKYLKFIWQVKKSPTYFLRAEDVFGFIKKVQSMQSDLQELADTYSGDDYGSKLARGSVLGQKQGLNNRHGENPNAFSHGETFLNLFESRFVPNSLYILDEPEAALSFTRQLTFLHMLNKMMKQNCQFIITTHSPIIASFPGAEIFQIENSKIEKVEYKDIENFSLYKGFLNNPEVFLRYNPIMKEMQKTIKKFCDDNNMNSSLEIRALDLVTEVGEVSKEIIKMTNYGSMEFEFREEVKSELGDVLFALAALANTLDVDLEDSLNLVLEKYSKRLQKGSAGSENE